MELYDRLFHNGVSLVADSAKIAGLYTAVINKEPIIGTIIVGLGLLGDIINQSDMMENAGGLTKYERKKIETGINTFQLIKSSLDNFTDWEIAYK